MSFKATVSAGWTYTTGDTATAANLNALGIPDITVPDNQTYLANVGTVSTPGIAFNGDANTGLAQLSGADTISIVAGGASPVVFSGDQSAFSNGTDAKPAITFFGDADTGINHNATNEVDIVCGGAVIGAFYSGGMNVVGAIEADSITVNGVAVRTTGISTTEFTYSHDFLGAVAASGMDTAVTATGAVAPVASTFDPDWRGLCGLSASAVSDRAVLSTPMNLAIGGLARVRMKLGAGTGGSLSTGSERYYVLIGMVHVTTETLVSATGSGAWFQYDDATSAQWQTVTRKVGTKETQTTASTVAASNTYFTLEIRRIASEEFKFYIDGTLATTHTTSAPSVAHNYLACIIEKSIGSTLRGIAIDSIEIVNPVTRV